MNSDKRVFKRGEEKWQAFRHTGYTGQVSAAGTSNGFSYKITFTRLDSNGDPLPNIKTVCVSTNKPWDSLTDNQFVDLLNDELAAEPD